MNQNVSEGGFSALYFTNRNEDPAPEVALARIAPTQISQEPFRAQHRLTSIHPTDHPPCEYE